MLVNIWTVLRTPIHINLSIKITAMIRALCCLHGWIIDGHYDDNNIIPPLAAMYSFSVMNRCGRIFPQEHMNGEVCVGGIVKYVRWWGSL